MSTSITVRPGDPRYDDLTVGINQRYAAKPEYVRIMRSTEQVVSSVQEAIDHSKRCGCRIGHPRR